MKFASVKQIIVLTAITCVGLFALDYYKNPQLWHARSVSTARPGVRLTLWMNHLCCLGCLADVRQALAEIPGIDVANAATAVSAFAGVDRRMSEIGRNTPNPGADGRLGALVFARGGSRFNDTYWKEFGPRLGLAYQVNNNLAVRAGYAMTNTPPIRNDWGYGGFTLGFNGSVPVAAGTSPTGFIDDPAIYLSQPYPSQGSLPNTDPAQLNYDGPWLATARNDNRPGYMQNYSLTVQYLLPQQTVLEVAFVGNKGTRLWGGVGAFSEYDGLPAKQLSLGGILTDSVSNHPQYMPYPSFPGNLSVAQALRPYPQYFGVEEAFPYNSSSNYNSLQITATRHLTSGLGFLAAYTWSKAIGYVDQNGPASYFSGIGRSRGPGNYFTGPARADKDGFGEIGA